MSRRSNTVTKREALEITLEKFDKSVKGVNDYIELILVVGLALQPETGILSRSQIERAVNEMIAQRDKG